MEPFSSSGESIRSIETYATAANHLMPAILKAHCVILLCGLFGVRWSHDRCIPYIAETNRPRVTFFIQRCYKMHCGVRLHGQNACYVIFWNIAPKHWI